MDGPATAIRAVGSREIFYPFVSEAAIVPVVVIGNMECETGCLNGIGFGSLLHRDDVMGAEASLRDNSPCLIGLNRS